MYTLKEFIELKGSNALTREQMRLFGVKDLNKGWLNRFSNNTVDDDGWNYAVKSLKNSRGVIPKRKMHRQCSKQYLYLMKNQNGIYKIGVSIDVKKRAASLSSSSGMTVVPLKVWHTGDHDSLILEKMLLENFKSGKTIGEWFTWSRCPIDECVSKLTPLKGVVEIPIERLI